MSQIQVNILFMLHLPPPVHGSSIVGELVKESKIINELFHTRYLNIIMSRKVEETGKASLRKIVRLAEMWLLLLVKLIHRRPRLCYYSLTTTGAGFFKDVILISLLRLFHVKIIYHIHNKGIKQFQKKKLNHILYRFVFKNSRVILLSKHLYYDIETYVSEEHVFYCPNGIKDYQPKTAFLSLPEKRIFKILFLSNLIREKGVFVLIEACSILRDKGYSFQCDFIGGEGDVTEKQLNSFIKQKELAEHVKYLGKRYGKLKELAFEQADVFVLPSRYDCFPLVILEAMQHSLPVISAHEGGMPDMVDDGSTGFLIPVYDDAEGLAKRIEYLLSNPFERKKMGVNGRIKYENNFTLPIFEKRFLSILQEAVK